MSQKKQTASNTQPLEILNDETVIDAAERVSAGAAIEVVERGGGLVPSTKLIYQGIALCYDAKVTFDFTDVRGLSKYIYLHDIHVANPSVIDTLYWVNLQNNRHVTLRIHEDTFLDLRSKLKRGSEVIYVYNSINELPQMRQYVKVNNDTWPTEEEIVKMDIEISKQPGQDTWVSRDQKHKAEKNVVRYEAEPVEGKTTEEFEPVEA